MYRGLLKSVARVWNPRAIQDLAIQQQVLAHMQSAERGLRRAEAARNKAGLGAFAATLRPLKLTSLDQVDKLKTLQEIVATLEARGDWTKAQRQQRLAGLLESLDPMYPSFYRMWVRQGRADLVSPDDFEVWKGREFPDLSDDFADPESSQAAATQPS